MSIFWNPNRFRGVDALVANQHLNTKYPVHIPANSIPTYGRSLPQSINTPYVLSPWDAQIELLIWRSKLEDEKSPSIINELKRHQLLKLCCWLNAPVQSFRRIENVFFYVNQKLSFT